MSPGGRLSFYAPLTPPLRARARGPLPGASSSPVAWPSRHSINQYSNSFSPLTKGFRALGSNDSYIATDTEQPPLTNQPFLAPFGRVRFTTTETHGTPSFPAATTDPAPHKHLCRGPSSSWSTHPRGQPNPDPQGNHQPFIPA